MSNNSIKKAASYTRVSTEEQTERFGLGVQRDEIEAYAKKIAKRCRVLNTGGIQARNFYRRIGTLPKVLT